MPEFFDPYDKSDKAKAAAIAVGLGIVDRSTVRACEDCGDPVDPGHRRFRCVDCGKLVCSWCIGHVHRRKGEA